MQPVRVYLETGQRWVFACALDWPGWCRRGKGEEAALEALLHYGERYRAAVPSAAVPSAAVPSAAGAADPTAVLDVVGRVASRAGMADFGAPGAVGPWDQEPLAEGELDRHISVLEASWSYLDAVAAGSPEELRKGPRGGGRDRTAMLDHVREAERAYSAKVSGRIPPRTPWEVQRTMIGAGLRSAPTDSAWPVRYAIRRMAWHVIDHAWEMQDRAT